MGDMDLIVEFFQKTLPSSFGFEDDFVIDSLRESVEELSSLQLDTRAHEKTSTSSQSKQSSHSHSSHGDLTSSHQHEPAKLVSNSIPVVKVSHSNTEVSDSDDEPIVTADAELSVIIEDPDESIISSRSICSSRDDLSSSFDFYEDLVLIETDHLNTPALRQGINRHRLPLRDVVDKRDVMMFQLKLRLLFERKLDEKEKTKSKVNFVKRVRIQNLETVDSKEMPKRPEVAEVIVERQM